MDADFKLFVLSGAGSFGQTLSQALGREPDPHKERDFEDGEHKFRPLTNVRNHNVFVVQSLNGDEKGSVNDKLCHLLFFIGALKDAGADQVHAVTPYMCYARKDRKTKARDPVTTKYIARLFEALGVDSVITMDVHNLQAFQNAFRCRTEHLEAKQLFVDSSMKLAEGKELAVMSPDFGGAKRADAFRKALADRSGQEIPLVLMEKKRSSGVVSGEGVMGEVQGRTVLILDDMISSGGTMARAARACKERGAREVIVAATHGVFLKKANEKLADPAIDKVMIGNTIPSFGLKKELYEEKVEVVDVTPYFASAIQGIHTGGSIVELMEAEE